ncbi:adenylate/guanylate cyclase domain-containing protein [Nocardia terrae]|nr:adenylate/guanylate cyclase domain-containing protein [Nocardia terrae]
MDGMSSSEARNRESVLLQLVECGAHPTQIIDAARDRRLGHLLLERSLTETGTTYTLSEIAHATGLEQNDISRWFRATGRAASNIDTAAAYGQDDLRLASVLAEYRELGLDEATMFTAARVMGRNTWAVADVAEQLIVERLGDSHDDPKIALRLAHELNRFAEFQTRILAHAVATNIRTILRADATDSTAAGAEPISVCFADLVGFTSLGEHMPPADLGQLADQLDTLTTDIIKPPVRFIKTLGDAVMLVSPDTDALAAVTLDLIRAAARDALPPIHAGIAHGYAVPSGGDWIGRPVNRAARIAAVASPHTVLIDDSSRQQMSGNSIRTTPAGQFGLKGLADPVELFRLSTAISHEQ